MPPSVEVARREKDGAKILEAADTFADVIGAGVAARLAAVVAPGETVPDVPLFIRLLGRVLAADLAALVAADAAHQNELGDDNAPRRTRDVAKNALHERIVRVRGAIAQVYGPDVAADAGFDERTPQDAHLLRASAARYLSWVANPSVPPTPLDADLSLDLHAQAASVAPLVANLATALKAVDREEREAQATLGIKDSAMMAADGTTSDTVALLVALARHAARDDLAERIRPTRPGVRAPEAEAPVTEPTPG